MTTLISLLGRSESSYDGVAQGHIGDLLDNASSRCLSFIHAFEDFSCVKPSMLFLDQLLSKRLKTASSLLALSAAAEASARVDAPKDLPLEHSLDWDHDILEFSGTLLRWTLHSNIGSSAGKLLVSFFQRVMNEPVIGLLEKSTPPIWLRPLRDFVGKHPDSLKPLERYVVPDLLQMSPSDTSEFLHSLPLKTLLHGNVSQVREEDIRLCLVTIKTLGERSWHSDIGRRITPTSNL